MSLISIIITLIIIGVLLWVVNSLIPMDAKVKMIVNVVVIIAILLWLLQEFGLMNYHLR
jgi:hypothetical protein